MANNPSIKLSFPEYLQTVSTVADLRAFSPNKVKANDVMCVTGRAQFSDGLGAFYVWDPFNTTPDDNSGYIRPSTQSGAGRWVRINNASSGPQGPQGQKGDPGIGFPDLNASTGASIVGYMSRKVADKLAEQISVKDFGAKGDNATDDTAAIQAALDFVQSKGGGTVFFPAGDYKTSAGLVLPSRVSVEGQGQFTTIRPTLAHGFIITKSDVIGARRIANLWIYGNGGNDYAGIYSDIAYPEKAQGICIEGVYISFFGTGIRSRGLWHAVFRTVTINQCHMGINFPGRSIKVLVDDCRITNGGLVVNPGDSTGILVGDPDVVDRPEDVQISDSIIFGFKKAIVWRLCLFGGVRNCDLDGCQKVGLELVTADGGFVFRDNWIQVDNDTEVVYGINATAVGYLADPINLAITNNRISATTVNSQLGNYGIKVGSQQSHIMIDGNSVTGSWNRSLVMEVARRISVRDNKFSGGVYLANTTDCSLADNYIAGGIELQTNNGLSVGKNGGPHNTKITGRIPIPAGQQNGVTTTFASMGLPNLPTGNYDVHLTFNNDSGTTSRGNIYGTATSTTIVVYYQTAFGVASSISFQATVF